MTTPFRLPDYAPPSQTGEAEWQQFNARSQALLEQMTTLDALHQSKKQIGARGLAMPSQEFLGTLPQAVGAAPTAPQATNELFDTGQPRVPTSQLESLVTGKPPFSLSTSEYEHLLQAAHFWEIDHPESIDPQVLAAEVEARRAGNAANRPTERSASDVPTALFGSVVAGSAAFAGASADLLGAVKEIPFAGPNLAKILHADNGVQWLRNLGRNVGAISEGLQQSLPREWDDGAYSFMEHAGAFGGEAVPFTLAWEAIGASTGIGVLGKVGGRISAFDRAAMVAARAGQGIGTGMLMSAGSNKSDEEKQQLVWGGGLLAGAMEGAGQALVPILSRVVPRIRSALGIPQVMEGPRVTEPGGPAYTFAEPGTSVLRTSEENADWSFIENKQLPPPGGGGGTPLLTAPVEGPGTGQALGAGRSPWALPDGQPRGLLARPANPSDMVEATYGANYIKSAAMRHADGTIERLDPADPFHRTAIQWFEKTGSIGDLYQGSEFGYLNDQGNFLDVQQAAPVLEGMHPDDVGLLHRPQSYFDAVGLGESVDTKAPDYGSKTFMEAKPVVRSTDSVLALTRIRHPETGVPERMYHGTGYEFDQPKTFDAPSDPENQLFGPGYYTTNNPDIASGYAPDLGHYDPEELRFQIEDSKRTYARYQAMSEEQVLADHARTKEEALADIQREIDNFQRELDNPPKPQVRPQYLDIRNPFDIDGQVQPEHIQAIAVAMQKNGVPDASIQNFIGDLTDKINLPHDPRFADQNFKRGEYLYGALTDAPFPRQGPSKQVGGWLSVGPDQRVGKALANKILEDAGFDGIVHIGGARTGNDAHRVAIAFRASQVHPAYEPHVLQSLEAEKLAAQMVRQQIVMDSPTLPELAGKPTLSDVDVAKAAVASNPGGVTVIKGVGLPAEVMASLKSNEVRFAIRQDGGLDALVGSGVTQDMAEEYQQFGMWKGQRGVYNGQEVTILTPGEDVVGVTLAGPRGGPEVPVSREGLLLGRSGVPKVEAPAEWEVFKNETLSYADAEAQKAGMESVSGMTDYRVASILQPRIEEYFDQLGLDPAGRQVMREYFGQRWAEEFRGLAPQEAELESLASIMANEQYAEVALDPEMPPAPIETVAESRGFVWLSAPGSGGQLMDQVGGEQLPAFDTDEAARAFLDGADRELPDLAPASDVPLEVMHQGPPSRSGTNLEPGPMAAGGAERELENALAMADAADVDYGAEADMGGGVGSGGGDGGAGGGGGRIGGPPDEPNPWTGPLGRQQGPEFPSLGQRIANQIHGFMEANPNQYALWRQQILESVIWKNRPTRYKFLAYEQYLNKIGAVGNRSWSMIDDFFTSITQAHNEATPWHRRASEILSRLPSRFMRSGDFVRVHELTDPTDQERVWQIIRKQYKWSDSQYADVRRASDDVKQFYQDLFRTKVDDPKSALDASREIFNYIPRMRAAQAAGKTQAEGAINPLIEDFAEYAREGGLQFRQMDIRDLMYHSVAATFNKKWMAEPFAELVNTWSHPGIPDEVKEPILGIARLARYGQDMGHSAAVRGVKMVFRTLGMPVSTREAAGMLNTPMGWNYKALLGGRPSVLFRDAIQPLKAGLKVGMPKVLDIYRRAFSSPSFKAEMIDQGIKGGWVEVDRAQFEGAGLFERTAESNADLGPITEAQVARREAFARVGDVIRDAIPARVRNLGQTLDPLRPYAKVSGLWNRAIAGRAGWETATEAIQDFRAVNQSVAMGESQTPMTMDQLMERSSAGSFEPAIRDKFTDFINRGQDEEAANFIARQTADWSQGRYGTKETMQFNRGYTGRLVMQFGNFAPQELESVVSMAKNGSAWQRTAGLLGYSAINYALYAAEAYTGWSFGKWAWAQGIAFGGGPAIDPAIQAYHVVQGTMQTVGGQTPSSDAVDAANRYARTSATDVIAPFFPYSGAFNTVDQLVQAMQGAHPIEQAARYAVTGDRGSRVDFQRQLEAAQPAAVSPNRQDRGPLVPQGALSPNGGTGITIDELRRRMTESQPAAPQRHPHAGSFQ